MVKAFVFYDSKYGNTRLAAEKVAEGLRSGNVEVDLGYIKEVSAVHALDYDRWFWARQTTWVDPAKP